MYVCRQQTSLAALSTLQGPLVDPRLSWYHRFFPDFLDLLFFKSNMDFFKILFLIKYWFQDNITWTVRAAQETYDWNWDTEEVIKIYSWPQRSLDIFWGGNAKIFLTPKKSDIFLPTPKLFSHSGSDLPAPQPCGCTGASLLTVRIFCLICSESQERGTTIKLDPIR